MSESHTPKASDEKQGEKKEDEKRDKKRRKVDGKKDTAEDDVLEFEELPRITFHIMPEWKLPALRPGIENNTTSDTVEGNTMCPPRKVRCARWKDQSTIIGGPSQAAKPKAKPVAQRMPRYPRSGECGA